MNRVASHDHADEASKEKAMSTTYLLDLSEFAPIPRSALGPAVNEQGYYVDRGERNLYWVTDGTYQSAFLTTPDCVVFLDAPPMIGNYIRRAEVDARSFIHIHTGGTK
jgi:hypothetical protein